MPFPNNTSSLTLQAPVDMFQQMMVLMESLNELKCHVNLEKQARHNYSLHANPVSADEEELVVPVTTVPVPKLLQPLLPFAGESQVTFEEAPSQPLPSTLVEEVHIANPIHVHIPTSSPSLVPTVLPHAPSPLSAVDWSLLINKVQSGDVPSITITPNLASSSTASFQTPLCKKFSMLTLPFSLWSLTPVHFPTVSYKWR